MAKKSDYSLFINFFFNSLKNRIIHYSLGPQNSLFINFLAHYSLFVIKKGHYSLIIIPHPDRHVWCLSVSYFVYLVSVDPDIGDIDGKKVIVNRVFV